ncbi:MAG: dTDP-4-dehydrorhamnose 3,5-epimerase [Nitrospira sp.]|nr:dTDP-4-dehydrorhamnose 3,5-epimerase [Nitrospira sp.]
MIFTEAALKGAFVIDPEPVSDERGMFARVWCEKEFEMHGLSSRWVQSSISVNRRKGTLRGMHYQVAPNEEVKLVRCTTGAIFDVIVDLRPTSSTYGQHIGLILTADSHRSLYIPKQFAHGFLTLQDNSEVSYHMSEFYAPSCAHGIRWDDPQLHIQWPEPIVIVSEKDQQWPQLNLNG